MTNILRHPAAFEAETFLDVLLISLGADPHAPPAIGDDTFICPSKLAPGIERERATTLQLLETVDNVRIQLSNLGYRFHRASMPEGLGFTV